MNVQINKARADTKREAQRQNDHQEREQLEHEPRADAARRYAETAQDPDLVPPLRHDEQRQEQHDRQRHRQRHAVDRPAQ